MWKTWDPVIAGRVVLQNTQSELGNDQNSFQRFLVFAMSCFIFPERSLNGGVVFNEECSKKWPAPPYLRFRRITAYLVVVKLAVHHIFWRTQRANARVGVIPSVFAHAVGPAVLYHATKHEFFERGVSRDFWWFYFTVSVGLVYILFNQSCRLRGLFERVRIGIWRSREIG